jgi:hypothetical protein
MTLLLVDAAGRPLTATWGERRVVNGQVVRKWPCVLAAWSETHGAPVHDDREWAEPPWATREASLWAFSGRRLWC